MSCGLCGGARNPHRYRVTLTSPEHKDDTPVLFLTEIEARIYATENGGGRIDVTT